MCWFTNSSGPFFFKAKLIWICLLSIHLFKRYIAAEFGWNRCMDSFATYVYGHSLCPFEVHFLILQTIF